MYDKMFRARFTKRLLLGKHTLDLEHANWSTERTALLRSDCSAITQPSTYQGLL
jgi:hypothetical protein